MLAAILSCFLAVVAQQPQLTEDQLRSISDLAQAAFQAGRYDEAAENYRKLVEALPDIPGLRMNLGMALYLAGRPADAVAPLEKATAGNSKLAPAWLFLGASLLETGRPAKATAPLAQYLKANPKERRALELLGDAQSQVGNYAEAISAYRQAIASDPGSSRSWFGLGRCYEALAGKSFDQLNRTAQDTAYWFALIAESRLSQQQYSSAYFFFRKALEQKPDLRGVHAAIAVVYRKSGHPDWAEQEEKKELALGKPDCQSDPYPCSFFEGRLDELLVGVSKNNTPESLYWQVRAYNQLAKDAFDKLTSLPPSVEAYQFLAEVNRNQGRHRESVNELMKALELAPGHPLVRRELAISMYLNRDYDRALALIRELLETDPDSAQFNYLAGDILLYQQKVEEAVVLLEKAVKSEPGYQAAQSALGRALMQIGEAERAIPHLKAALNADEDGSLHFQLARAYQRTGQRELAQTALKQYQEIQARNEAQEKEVEEEVRVTPP